MSAPAPSGAGDLELTLLTVVLDKHYGYLRQQIALIDALNPGALWRMVVVDNSSSTEPPLQIADPRVEVIAGVSSEGMPAEGRGSYHHAAALHLGLQRVDTRFLLVIDPDFFVLYPDWIEASLDHMRRRALTLFGAPWHYSWQRKWRDFPCVHFLLIDLHKLPISRIDFSPAVAEDRQRLGTPLQSWLKSHAPVLHARLLLQSRRDTGWLIRRDFKRKTSAYDVVLPVLDVAAELDKPKYLRTARARWLEPKLPRRWSFFPVAGSYLSPGEIPALMHPSIQALSPEAFAWRGQPFAIHMRRNMRDKARGRTEADEAREDAILQEVLQTTAAAGSWAGE